MAKKPFYSKIDTEVETQLQKLKIELSEPNGELPTIQSVNESVERLTTTPERIEKAVSMVMAEKKKPKASKADIERGRDAKGELDRVGITALIDRMLLQDVKVYAIQRNVSMSDVINDALSKYLNR